MLAISAESPQRSESYLRSHPLPYPTLVDADHEVFDAYDVTSRLISLGQRPALFVVDADGVVRYAHRALSGLTYRPTDELVEAVEALAKA